MRQQKEPWEWFSSSNCGFSSRRHISFLREWQILGLENCLLKSHFWYEFERRHHLTWFCNLEINETFCRFFYIHCFCNNFSHLFNSRIWPWRWIDLYINHNYKCVDQFLIDWRLSYCCLQVLIRTHVRLYMTIHFYYSTTDSLPCLILVIMPSAIFSGRK